MSRLSRFAVNAAKEAAKKAKTKAKRSTPPSLSVPNAKPKKKPVVKALPAPPKPLALPAPGPGLPDFAAKPRGGQWWADKEIAGTNYSPEFAARQTIPAGVLFSSDARDKALREWWERALPKYIKNDFAGPNDPLRDLAERGLLHIPDTDADTWSQMASESFSSDPLQEILFPRNPKGGMPGAGDEFRGEVVSAMPWLTRVPATDELYGVNPRSLSGLDFPHVADEMRNAMSVAGDFPADLAVRPESLARMSFPQAVERVGRINQWRAKKMEEAALAAMDNPAIQVFKEYQDDNPMGLRWVELKAPTFTPETLPEGYSLVVRDNNQGGTYYSLRDDYDRGFEIGAGQTPEAAIRAGASRIESTDLQDALQYEGDTMGHCVGGYCDDVVTGRSRIFSLRDAKGEPHVTIETRPGRERTALSEIPRDALDEITAAAKADTDAVAGPMGIGPDDPRWARTYQTNLALKQREWLSANPTFDDIIQIKGKQNRAPKDDYLPFVQDFVKSQQWDNVGDLGNTGLVKLPDGRYITEAQYNEGLNTAASAFGTSSPETLTRLVEWERLAPHFEGYAVGGRVDADRCFCRHPMSVRKK